MGSKLPDFRTVPPVIIPTDESISVMMPWGNRCSIASADNMGGGTWSINRVNVLKHLRGCGVGRILLTALVQSCKNQGAKRIQVVPGGYGGNILQQYSFYMESGFRRSGESGVFVYNVLNALVDA